MLQELRVDEQRQSALDKALLVAMSGDLEEAEKEIKEVERLGASTGEVRMLRGQLALHSGRSIDALEDLKQAVSLMPKSVVARAMLPLVYFNLGQPVLSRRINNELEGMPAATPEDYLFKGYALATSHASRALPLLDEAIHRRPSVIALAIR